MLDGDSIERFKAVYQSERFPILLEYAEPSGPVGRVRRFVYASLNLLEDNRTDFLVQSRRYWNITLDPRFVGYDWNGDWGEEVLSETPSLLVIPGEGFVVYTH